MKKTTKHKLYAMKVVALHAIQKFDWNENPLPQKGEFGLRDCPFVVKCKHKFETMTQQIYILE